MKSVLGLSAAFVTLVLLGSCASLPSSVTGALGSVVPSGGGGAVAAASAAPVDFTADMVLATDSESQTEGNYYVVKVLTPASAATKNQAKVLRVSDGKEMWVNFVTPSHKTVQAQLSLGASVFYEPGDSGYDKITADDYTHGTWRLGKVTGLDNLYKGQVQISGDLYYVKWTRMPN